MLKQETLVHDRHVGKHSPSAMPHSAITNSIPTQSFSIVRPFLRIADEQYGTIDDVADQCMCALFASGYPSLRSVTVSVEADNVSLEGSVPTYHLKQLAQSLVQKVDGVGVLRNHLEVS